MSSVAYVDVAIGLLATLSFCAALSVLLHNFGGSLQLSAPQARRFPLPQSSATSAPWTG